ncbi:MAG: alpha-ketoglutarate-dependent dioxygenase AlkB [Oceanicaulis sp.]
MIGSVLPPPGARIIRNFVSAQEAERLLMAIDASPWRADLKRRVQHYGWRYDYRERRVTQEMRLGPPPDWLLPLAEAVGELAEFDRRPDQVIVNEYRPGQGIAAHVDCEPCFGPAIASLSLGGSAEMVFSNRRSGERGALMLAPLNLLILAGQARYDWTHEIPARKSDVIDGERRPRARRVSLTFRTVIT